MTLDLASRKLVPLALGLGLGLACSRGPVGAEAGVETTGASGGFEGSGESGSPSPSETHSSPGESESESESESEAETETGTEAESTEEGVPCFESEFSFVPAHPNVVVMLDNSASMIATYDHDANPDTPTVSRWAALHGAVDNILAAYDERIDFGAKVFPRAGGCTMSEGVDVPCAPLNANAILSDIPSADSTNNSGLTPSGTAFVHTLDYLNALPSELPRAIIFMADGSTSVGCDPPNTGAQIVPLLEAAYNNGNTPSIPTFVVGINADTDLTVDQLESFARAGGGTPQPGQPTFFDAQDQAALESAMDQILSDVVSCNIPLEEPPPFPEAVRVYIEDATYTWLDDSGSGFDCESETGFRYLGELEIELCGQACDTFKGLELPAANIEYFCEFG